MATLPIKPLGGAGGYQRWKESLLLRVRTLGIDRVLFQDPPHRRRRHRRGACRRQEVDGMRDDDVCRGHILATLSDRLLPDYQRFATAAELWRALARTYDVDTPRVWRQKFDAFVFKEGGTGEELLEQIAHAEAMGAAAKLSDGFVADALCAKLPDIISNAIIMRSGLHGAMTMGLVWDVARRVVSFGGGPELLWSTMTDD